MKKYKVHLKSTDGYLHQMIIYQVSADKAREEAEIQCNVGPSVNWRWHVVKTERYIFMKDPN